MQRVVLGAVDAVQFEKRYVHRDGHIVWVQLTASLVRDPTGQPLYTSTQLLDISARHAAEEALRHSEARLRGFIEALPVGAVLTSPHGER
jgi:PAS domain-containing protein